MIWRMRLSLYGDSIISYTLLPLTIEIWYVCFSSRSKYYLGNYSHSRLSRGSLRLRSYIFPGFSNENSFFCLKAYSTISRTLRDCTELHLCFIRAYRSAFIVCYWVSCSTNVHFWSLASIIFSIRWSYFIAFSRSSEDTVTCCHVSSVLILICRSTSISC